MGASYPGSDQRDHRSRYVDNNAVVITSCGITRKWSTIELMTKKILIALLVCVVAVAGFIAIAATISTKPLSTPSSKNGSYVAFGDSVAAGVGLKDYSDSSACNRTKQAYPNAIAAKFQYKLTSQACSGASTQSGLINSQTVNNLLLPAQINAIDANVTPKLITITIGANDANWTDYIQKCYTETCGSSSDTSTIDVKLSAATSNLDSALTRISARYPDATPTTVVTGYYKLFTASGSQNCAELTGIDKSEIAWINQLQNTIDSMLKSVAAKHGFALYVPIDFANHELCSSDSWIQSINETAPFHPTQKGQEEIANQLVKALNTKGYKE